MIYKYWIQTDPWNLLRLPEFSVYIRIEPGDERLEPWTLWTLFSLIYHGIKWYRYFGFNLPCAGTRHLDLKPSHQLRTCLRSVLPLLADQRSCNQSINPTTAWTRDGWDSPPDLQCLFQPALRVPLPGARVWFSVLPPSPPSDSPESWTTPLKVIIRIIHSYKL